MELSQLAERLSTALSLNNPPVGLSFVEGCPDHIPTTEHVTPSACSFWRLAEAGTFYAPADAHFNCPIGSMVMGFPLSESVQNQLGELVNMMCECEYIDPAEAEHIPTHTGHHSGIVYGPLAEHPFTPTVALTWLTPRQAMLCNEAGGSARWSSEASPRVTGRPACAALPLAISGGTPVMSFGCAGMRTFTEVEDERMLVAVPGNELPAFAKAAEASAAANVTMTDFYQQHKATLSQGAKA